MPNILVLGEQPQFRTLLSESLWFDDHRVESVTDAAMLWDHLSSTQPDLVLLDAHSNGFGAMRLYQDLRQQFPDLAVMVYQCRNYGDLDHIKGAVADALIEYSLRGSAETVSTFRDEKKQTARIKIGF
jgi:CheY-like chemotaxis protein